MNFTYVWSAVMKWNKVFLFLGFIWLAGCATHPKVSKPSVELNSLPALTHKHNIQSQWDGVSQVITLFYQGQRIEVLVGSALVLKNGQKVVLSRAVDRQKSIIIFPTDFVQKVLAVTTVEKIAIPTEFGLMKFREIIIDPGHGGKDPGAISRKGIKEKDVVLDISLKLKATLEQKGFKVTLTRDADEFISLEERTSIASRSKADFFVSIHANASRNKKVQGMEIYYSREPLASSGHFEQQQKENILTLSKHTQMKSESQVIKDILMDMMCSVKQSESQEFGQSIIRQASRAIDTPNRGCRSSRFFVVRNTLIPAVLIEVGYLTNRNEEGLLETASYRQKIADAIAESIFDYANDS